uniref:Uncharacterized protein n=1 Tax=Opuntia streptacantha TaxID=393608 RepID=A0A7C9AC20_OPUST
MSTEETKEGITLVIDLQSLPLPRKFSLHALPYSGPFADCFSFLFEECRSRYLPHRNPQMGKKFLNHEEIDYIHFQSYWSKNQWPCCLDQLLFAQLRPWWTSMTLVCQHA